MARNWGASKCARDAVALSGRPSIPCKADSRAFEHPALDAPGKRRLSTFTSLSDVVRRAAKEIPKEYIDNSCICNYT